MPARPHRSPPERLPLRAVPVPLMGIPSQPTADLPDPEFLQRICRALLEAMHGLRPLSQLQNVMDAKVLEQLGLRQRFQRNTGQPTLLCARGYPGGEAGVEISATFGYNGRVYPMAVRLDRLGNGWRITGLEVGPH